MINMKKRKNVGGGGDQRQETIEPLRKQPPGAPEAHVHFLLWVSARIPGVLSFNALKFCYLEQVSVT